MSDDLQLATRGWTEDKLDEIFAGHLQTLGHMSSDVNGIRTLQVSTESSGFKIVDENGYAILTVDSDEVTLSASDRKVNIYSTDEIDIAVTASEDYSTTKLVSINMYNEDATRKGAISIATNDMSTGVQNASYKFEINADASTGGLAFLYGSTSLMRSNTSSYAIANTSAFDVNVSSRTDIIVSPANTDSWTGLELLTDSACIHYSKTEENAIKTAIAINELYGTVCHSFYRQEGTLDDGYRSYALVSTLTDTQYPSLASNAVVYGASGISSDDSGTSGGSCSCELPAWSGSIIGDETGIYKIIFQDPCDGLVQSGGTITDTIEGTAPATIEYAVIGSDSIRTGDITKIAITCPTTTASGFVPSELYLHIGRYISGKGYVDEVEYEHLGCSTNTVTQVLGETGTWLFDSVPCDGSSLIIIPSPSSATPVVSTAIDGDNMLRVYSITSAYNSNSFLGTAGSDTILSYCIAASITYSVAETELEGAGVTEAEATKIAQTVVDDELYSYTDLAAYSTDEDSCTNCNWKYAVLAPVQDLYDAYSTSTKVSLASIEIPFRSDIIKNVSPLWLGMQRSTNGTDWEDLGLSDNYCYDIAGSKGVWSFSNVDLYTQDYFRLYAVSSEYGTFDACTVIGGKANADSPDSANSITGTATLEGAVLCCTINVREVTNKYVSAGDLEAIDTRVTALENGSGGGGSGGTDSAITWTEITSISDITASGYYKIPTKGSGHPCVPAGTICVIWYTDMTAFDAICILSDVPSIDKSFAAYPYSSDMILTIKGETSTSYTVLDVYPADFATNITETVESVTWKTITDISTISEAGYYKISVEDILQYNNYPWLRVPFDKICVFWITGMTQIYLNSMLGDAVATGSTVSWYGYPCTTGEMIITARALSDSYETVLPTSTYYDVLDVRPASFDTGSSSSSAAAELPEWASCIEGDANGITQIDMAYSSVIRSSYNESNSSWRNDAIIFGTSGVQKLRLCPGATVTTPIMGNEASVLEVATNCAGISTLTLAPECEFVDAEGYTLIKGSGFGPGIERINMYGDGEIAVQMESWFMDKPIPVLKVGVTNDLTDYGSLDSHDAIAGITNLALYPDGGIHGFAKLDGTAAGYASPIAKVKSTGYSFSYILNESDTST